jgi:hypothetical protein
MTRDEVIKLLEPYTEDDLRYIRDIANSLQEEKRTERKKAEIETSVAQYQGKWWTRIETHQGMHVGSHIDYPENKTFVYIERVKSVGNGFLWTKVKPYVQTRLVDVSTNFLLEKTHGEQHAELQYYKEIDDFRFDLDERWKECTKDDVLAALEKVQYKTQSVTQQIKEMA